jgi:hypothetical protein
MLLVFELLTHSCHPWQPETTHPNRLNRKTTVESNTSFSGGQVERARAGKYPPAPVRVARKITQAAQGLHLLAQLVKRRCLGWIGPKDLSARGRMTQKSKCSNARLDAVAVHPCYRRRVDGLDCLPMPNIQSNLCPREDEDDTSQLNEEPHTPGHSSACSLPRSLGGASTSRPCRCSSRCRPSPTAPPSARRPAPSCCRS